MGENKCVVLIGPGDVAYYYEELLGMDRETLTEEIERIAEVLVKAHVELVLLPDKGICFEVAKAYKGRGGTRVIGTVPFQDKTFSIEHLKPYMNATVKVDGQERKIFDEFIDTGTWYEQDLIMALFGDAILYLGTSLGSMRELTAAYYLYKLIGGKKKGVDIEGKKIHPAIRAGEDFTTIIYEPFVKERLSSEISAYIKEVGGRIVYVKDKDNLREKINRQNE